jgi:lysylphosphatidylglycerol synthetase-like protein (DUF2156 family)
MTQLTQAPTDRVGAYVRTVRWGIAVLVGMAAIVVYGAYGDQHPKASQESAVPAIIAVMAVITAVVFGALVAPGLRGIAGRTGRWAGIALTLGILGLLAVPMAAWSGLPLALGAAAALLGTAGRAAAQHDGRKATLPSWALGVGVAAIVLSVVMVVLGNTVMSN